MNGREGRPAVRGGGQPRSVIRFEVEALENGSCKPAVQAGMRLWQLIGSLSFSPMIEVSIRAWTLSCVE